MNTISEFQEEAVKIAEWLLFIGKPLTWDTEKGEKVVLTAQILPKNKEGE